MEDTTPVQQPVSTPSTPEVPAKKNSSWGVVIALLLILAMMVVGAFYAWGKRINQQSGYTASLPRA